MAYRFTNTNKWSDSWFIELKPNGKLMFNYLSDNCDCAGFYELSMKKFRDALHPLTDEEIKIAFAEIEKCYVLSRDKKILLLKNFCKHQKNIPLNPTNKSHIGIFRCLENYKSNFAFDVLKIINKDAKQPEDKGASKGLQRGTGIGNGNNIDFNNFWSLYDKKVGNKEKCEKKWNLLKIEIQKKILEILPDWKKQFTEKQFQPYPETFLGNGRWEDEIILPEKKKIKAEFPDFYDKNFEGKLSPKDCGRYWSHLREMGLIAKKDNQQTVVDWVKAS